MRARRLGLSVAIFALAAAHDADGRQGRCLAAPGAPTSLTVTASGTTVTVSWAAPSGECPAGSYVIEAGSQPGRNDLPSVFSNGAETRLVLRNIMEALYYVRVRAINAAGAGEPSNEVRIAVGHAEPDVVVARRTRDRNTYFPAIARLANGHLLVVFYDSPEHVSAEGRISVVKSVDGGRTWSAPLVAVDSPLDDRDPSIMATTGGTLLLSYFSVDQAGAPGSGGVFVARSADQGATWSPPAKVATTLRNPASSARIVELENGDLLIPIYGATAGRARSAIIRSSDQGRSWPEGREAVINSPVPLDLVEPALVNLGMGHLRILMRTEGSDGLAMDSRSSDGGRTWSQPASIGIAAQGSDLLLTRRSPKGPAAVVHTWGDWSRRFGSSRPSLMQLIEFPEPPGAASFGAHRMVYNSHCDDAAYPSAVMLTNERFLVVFYDACAGYIGGRFLTLNDLRP